MRLWGYEPMRLWDDQTMRAWDDETMRLWDYETSFGALGTSLGSSWSLFDSSWGLLGGSCKGIGSSSGALGDVLGSGNPLLLKNERFASVGARFWKQRKSVGEYESMRVDNEIIRLWEHETMRLWYFETMKPLLVLLERLWGPLGTSLTALGVWG